MVTAKAKKVFQDLTLYCLHSMCAKAIHRFILRRCGVDFAGVSSLFVLDFCLQRYQLVWSPVGGGGGQVRAALSHVR